MNKDRRKQIADIAASLKLAIDALDLESDIETIRDDEQTSFDNMPLSMQSGDKGQAAETAIGYLDEAIEALQEAISRIEDALGHLEEAAR